MIIVLFGAPGVGKGTQAAILAEKLHVAHLSTGDAFRAAIRNQTEIGKVAKTYVDAGDLVPDSVVASIVEEAMQDPSFARGAILDGFPRTRAQADALAEMLQRRGLSVHRVVNIDVDDATITERLLSRGRADDTAEIIANRLDVYRQETAPLLEYYSAVDSLLVTVNGVGDVQDVNQRILDTIYV